MPYCLSLLQRPMGEADGECDLLLVVQHSGHSQAGHQDVTTGLWGPGRQALKERLELGVPQHSALVRLVQGADQGKQPRGSER